VELTRLQVTNYKGLREIDIDLSRFVCVIGENNAGKSTLLQSLSLLVSGTSLSRDHFYDQSKDIRIAVRIDDISEVDLEKLESVHRQRIVSIIKGNSITLIRQYGRDGKGVLKYEAMVPADPKFGPQFIKELLDGKRPGEATRILVVGTYPELDSVVTAKSNQTEIKEAIKVLGDAMPDDQKVASDQDLPTGIDAGIKGLLPTIIYIPAVKDLGDDIKTKEGTPFGRVMRILLQAIEPDLSSATEVFESLNKMLNRQRNADGETTDERLTQVKTIESTVEKYLKECFANVSIEIEIPQPDVKTILSSARIFANDGVRGEIDTKGDGLRRAIVFSILRAYVQLSNSGELGGQETTEARSNDYLLLFEEPELYLHPNAQLVLFRALSLFSKRHTVLVTTHSPLFFGPEGTATFVKMRKSTQSQIGFVPFGVAHAVALANMSTKDQFQLVCFENNNSAFFASTVVLVEGDSDFIVFPHIGNLIRNDWGVESSSIRFARIGGKANICRYREFFNRFGIRVVVIADLDVLVDGFEKLGVSHEIAQQRSKLLELVDEVLNNESNDVAAAGADFQKLTSKGDAKVKWYEAKSAWQSHAEKKGTWDEVVSAVEDFFAYERKRPRLNLLSGSFEYKNVHFAKQKLLRELRGFDILVLSKGDIESYYPASVSGQDKPTKALSFCEVVADRDTALKLCEQQLLAEDDALKNEFELLVDLILS